MEMTIIGYNCPKGCKIKYYYESFSERYPENIVQDRNEGYNVIIIKDGEEMPRYCYKCGTALTNIKLYDFFKGSIKGSYNLSGTHI